MSDLRHIDIKDIPEIVEIFNHTQSAEEFNWLLNSPDNNTRFKGFVVTKAEKIVGVIGYITCQFAFNSELYPFIIPNSWRILDKNKGLNGILLLKKIITDNNHIMTIGGSAEAKPLLPFFKLQKTQDVEYFIKVFSPYQYFKSLKKKFYIKLWYLINSFSIHLRSFKGDVVIKPIDFDKFNNQFVSPQGIFQHQLTSDFVKWLGSCPVIESFTYNIYVNNSYVGPCVLYRKQVGENRYRGRIIFLPYVNNHQEWLKIVWAIEKIAQKLNCISVDIMCSNSPFRKVLIKCGFRNFPRKNLPVSIKTNQELYSIIRDKAHIQFSDGDIGYRNI